MLTVLMLLCRSHAERLTTSCDIIVIIDAVGEGSARAGSSVTDRLVHTDSLACTACVDDTVLASLGIATETLSIVFDFCRKGH